MSLHKRFEERYLRDALPDQGKRVPDPVWRLAKKFTEMLDRAILDLQTTRARYGDRGCTEQRANVTMMAPAVLGRERAEKLHAAILLRNSEIRQQTYLLFAQNPKLSHFLLMAEQSFREHSSGPLMQEELAEIVTIRLFQHLHEFAQILQSLLAHCQYSPGMGRIIRVHIPTSYPSRTVHHVRDKISKTAIDHKFVNTQLLQLEGMETMYAQLRMMHKGDVQPLIREMEALRGALKENGPLRGLGADSKQAATALLQHMSQFIPEPTIHDRDHAPRTKLPPIAEGALQESLHLLGKIPETERLIVLQCLIEEPAFGPFLTAFSRHLRKREVDPSTFRSTLQLRWVQTGLPSPFLFALSRMSEEWSLRADPHTELGFEVILPQAYPTPIVNDVVRLLAGIRREDFALLARGSYPHVTPTIARQLETIAFPSSDAPATPPESQTTVAPPKERAHEGVVPVRRTDAEPEDHLPELDATTEALLASGITCFGLSPGTVPRLRKAVRFGLTHKIEDRRKAVEEAARRLQNLHHSFAGTAQQGVVHAAALTLADRFKQLVEAVQKACPGLPEQPLRRGTATLSDEEQHEFRAFMLTVCVQMDQCQRQMEERQSLGEGSAPADVVSIAVTTAAQAISARLLEHHVGKRLQQYPHLASSVAQFIDTLEEETWNAIGDVGNADSLTARMRRMLVAVIPWMREAADECSAERRQEVPLRLLCEELGRHGIDLASALREFAAPAKKGSEAPPSSKDPRRTAISRYLRHRFPSPRRNISFQDAAEFLAQAGVVAERWDTEHPWYWVCRLPEHSGRHAISSGRAEQGFYALEIIHVLFGHNTSRGIGDIDALYNSLSSERKGT